ncbi:hypothetical protein ACFL27_03475 [candidate division CSSED10-310 bacterium]|uniref:SH3b domain-containing protein n=1 Tax=candidate division CSSED10-310 bacterium TaxID=2855610 RepID=A0ABV6YST5_UNCC1
MEKSKYWLMVFAIACGSLLGLVVMVRIMNLAFTGPAHQSMRNMLQQKIDEPGQSAQNKRVLEQTIKNMDQDMVNRTIGVLPDRKRGADTGQTKPEVVWQNLGKVLQIKQEGKVMNSPFAKAKEIATVSPGMKVTILEKRYTLLKIRLEQGTEGWIKEDLFSPKDEVR